MLLQKRQDLVKNGTSGVDNLNMEQDKKNHIIQLIF